MNVHVRFLCVFVVLLPLQQSKYYRTALDVVKGLVCIRRWIESLIDRSVLSTSAAAENMNKSGFSQPGERLLFQGLLLTLEV